MTKTLKIFVFILVLVNHQIFFFRILKIESKPLTLCASERMYFLLHVFYLYLFSRLAYQGADTLKYIRALRVELKYLQTELKAIREETAKLKRRNENLDEFAGRMSRELRKANRDRQLLYFNPLP